MIAVSWVGAALACLGYGIGAVLQGVGAQRTARATGASGVARILTQVPYLLGLTLDTLAFVANVVALQRLPLFLVQAILTASVGVTAVVAALRGATLTRRDWTSLGVLGLGLVLLGLSASSDSAVRISPTAQFVILASIVVPAVLGLVSFRLVGRLTGPALALAAGLAFSGVAVASRGLSAQPVGWSVLANPLLWTVVANGALGTVFFALALQRVSVTLVTAVAFLIEMVAPSVVGLLLFGDKIRPGWAVAAGVGFVLSVAGTAVLTRFAE